MAGPREIGVRPPAVAGMFYPDDPGQCQQWARELVRSGISEVPDASSIAGQRRLLGGIVPHAGWICSGAIAGQTIATIAASQSQQTQQGNRDRVVVVFGAIHTPIETDRAALDTHQRWSVPGGETDLPDEIQMKLVEQPNGLFAIDEQFHRREHAVEVELPLIQQAWPNASVLPIEVPVTEDAIAIGRDTARRLIDANLDAVFLASSDLTHYGPDYRFTPAGVGPEGLAWAKDNDRRLLDLVTKLEIGRIVPEVRVHWNACGGGAIAAMLSACREFGAAGATVLRHANSVETLADVRPQTSDNAVGYASVVVA